MNKVLNVSEEDKRGIRKAIKKSFGKVKISYFVRRTKRNITVDNQPYTLRTILQNWETFSKSLKNNDLGAFSVPDEHYKLMAYEMGIGADRNFILYFDDMPFVNIVSQSKSEEVSKKIEEVGMMEALEEGSADVKE
ncbi:hypothetical protein BPT24_272 [Tenacibaculum phage pT24]|uniref:Uncharacterized protein n=1 Tax=Tenacibaculum phage pT24 TaxID=1880590 RepID=A0A1B4XX56_9CAUD|nr:hypothetical protein HYP10_gp256 [Tenacibaculum phage pT24]BAV39389.1 hypothetical protein BPT24_272 [Tenacibaculum phage pT24]